MDIKNLLIKQFNQIENVILEKEEDVEFLRVSTKLRDLKAIESLSEQISKFLDEINYGKNQYYLDVFSSGIQVSDNEIEQLIKK